MEDNPTALTKAEIAMLYLPQHSTPAALRLLNEWIARNAELNQALLRTGYCKRTRLLTPAQVELLIKYLGEP